MATVALVGKGITFDSGGISIKPAANMDHMTSDMSGAAAVVATVIAAAALELPVSVIAYAAAGREPAVGHRVPARRRAHPLRAQGQKPRTTLVLNTDAEGRLVLVDAIARATEDDPDFLFETSTLTGAQIVALGTRTMGVMGTDTVRDRVAELAREVGEGGWAMPFPEELREGLDTPLADIANVSGKPAGGMLVAGHFMSEWVPDGPALGAPGRGRPGVQRRGRLRLHHAGRHGRPGAHPAGRPRRHRLGRPHLVTRSVAAGKGRGAHALPERNTGQVSPRASRSARCCRMICRRE